MKKLTKTFDSFDVVVVPFPFIDRAESKHRPAVILSSANSFNGQAGASVLAMITSATHATWPCDVAISDQNAAGLPVQSIIRMKLFTLDHRLIIKQIGKLSKNDQKELSNTLKKLFTLF